MRKTRELKNSSASSTLISTWAKQQRQEGLSPYVAHYINVMYQFRQFSAAHRLFRKQWSSSYVQPHNFAHKMIQVYYFVDGTNFTPPGSNSYYSLAQFNAPPLDFLNYLLLQPYVGSSRSIGPLVIFIQNYKQVYNII